MRRRDRPHPPLIVGVAGTRSDDETTAQPRVLGEDLERAIGCRDEPGCDQGRIPRQQLPRIRQMPLVHVLDLQSRIDRGTAEGTDDPRIGAAVRGTTRLRQRRLERHHPLAVVRVHDADVGIRHGIRQPFRRHGELPSDLRDLLVHPAGLEIVPEDATPVHLRARVERVPVPVGDESCASRDEQPRGLRQLPVVRGPRQRGRADRRRSGLGDEKGRLPGRPHPVGAEDQLRHVVGVPLATGALAFVIEGVLRQVVGVAAGDVEVGADGDIVHRGALIGDAGRQHRVIGDQLARDPGLPADELRGELGLEASPGEVVPSASCCPPGPTTHPTRRSDATSRRGPIRD